MSLRFNRRSLMRGLLGGGGVGVGIPALDIFLDGNGQAWADGAQAADPLRHLLLGPGPDRHAGRRHPLGADQDRRRL